MRGIPVTSVGTITAAFHESHAGSDKDVNATGRGRKIDQKYEEVIQVTGYADNVEGDVITNEPGDEMDIKDSTDPNRTYQVKSYNRTRPGEKTKKD